MPILSSIIRSFDLRHIGTCPTCIRISFFLMAVSWLFVVVAYLADLNSELPIIGGSFVFTFLWLSHVFARGIRSIPTNQPENLSRRIAIQAFAKAALGAVAVSVTLIPSRARADSGCGGWAGSSGCDPLTGPWARCYRQRTDCSYYACRSCGNDCGNNVC